MEKQNEQNVERERKFFNLEERIAQKETENQRITQKREERRANQVIGIRRKEVRKAIDSFVEEINNDHLKIHQYIEVGYRKPESKNDKIKQIRGNVKNIVYNEENPIEEGYVDLMKWGLLNKRVEFNGICQYDLRPKESDERKRERIKDVKQRQKKIEHQEWLGRKAVSHYYGGNLFLNTPNEITLKYKDLNEILDKISKKNGWEWNTCHHPGSQTGYGKGDVTTYYINEGNKIVATIHDYQSGGCNFLSGSIRIGGSGIYRTERADTNPSSYSHVEDSDTQKFLSSFCYELNELKNKPKK